MDTIDIMVGLIGELSNLNTPIVFKGANVLKMALENEGVLLNRGTRDIDGDWTSNIPSMEELTALINIALMNLGKGYTCKAYREYGKGKSAGFEIYSLGEKLFSMDISMHKNPFYTRYITKGGVEFNGVSLNKMVADKVHGVSEVKIFRRIKDMYDLYKLSQVAGFTTNAIYDILEFDNRALGEFKEFLGRVDDLKHAYDKYVGIIDKPEFNEVYQRVHIFIIPFITKCTGLTWSGEAWYMS